MTTPTQAELERFLLASEAAERLDRLAREQSDEARAFARDLRYIIDRGLGERTRPAIGALLRIARLIGKERLRIALEVSYGYDVIRRNPNPERWARNAELCLAETFLRRVRELERPDELGTRTAALRAAAEEVKPLAESFFPDDPKRQRNWALGVGDRTLRDRYRRWADTILVERGFLREPSPLATLFNSAGAPPRHSLVDRRAKPGPKCGSKSA